MAISCLLLSDHISANNLFNEETYKSLITDKVAKHLGDLLTVLIIETANATTSADLSSSKDTKTAIEANYNSNKHELGLNLNGKGAMQAKTQRVGKIKAALSVQIKQLLPNSTYSIEGNQRIQINGEWQTIVLHGIVRAEDISAQNTLLSTRIANAAITYTGEGSVSNAERKNTIYKLLSFMGIV